MARPNKSETGLPPAVIRRLRPPLLIVLGSPAEAADLAAQCAIADTTCYQMDVYQAARLREALTARGTSADVATLPDLWDLPPRFATVVYPTLREGERQLKIDMVEQAYHVLEPKGTILVLSDVDSDQLFPKLFKRLFGEVHADTQSRPNVYWGVKAKERPKRRHEMVFHARIGQGESLRFVSRPGTFAYGRMDDGARALVEVAEIHSGDRVLDLGCGCGTNGIFAGRTSGPEGKVTFVDSNVRALALAEHNAKLNGLTNFDCLASATTEELPAEGFDVALANPPYYANLEIARAFIERCRRLLSAKGRFYLVSRRIEELSELVGRVFPDFQVFMRRGYGVFFADVSG
jgi:16S rRNA G1207 methylase RsmC